MGLGNSGMGYNYGAVGDPEFIRLTNAIQAAADARDPDTMQKYWDELNAYRSGYGVMSLEDAGYAPNPNVVRDAIARNVSVDQAVNDFLSTPTFEDPRVNQWPIRSPQAPTTPQAPTAPSAPTTRPSPTPRTPRSLQAGAVDPQNAMAGLASIASLGAALSQGRQPAQPAPMANIVGSPSSEPMQSNFDPRRRLGQYLGRF